MINPNFFVSRLIEVGIEFAAGVPDSLLKHACMAIHEKFDKKNHVITANEGSAVGLAIGYYLAKKSPALVYMQNSGLGNAINPLTSLAHPEVYSIPMILMIGWRGEIEKDSNIQIKDEPQHSKQGKITLKILDLLDIPYIILDKEEENLNEVLVGQRKLTEERGGPVAIVVRKNTFLKYEASDYEEEMSNFPREKAIKVIIENIKNNWPIVSTTGMISRELFEIRKRSKQSDCHEFMLVGGMGHASQVASAIASERSDKKIICIDGDGSILMHAGSLAHCAEQDNIIHCVINNGAHDSVGGQPTAARNLSLSDLAKSFGFKHVKSVKNEEELKETLNSFKNNEKSSFIEIYCKRGSRENLGRPDKTPVDNKNNFIRFLEN